MADAVLAIKIVTDYAQGAAGLDAASTRAQKFGNTMSRLALPAAVALGALVKFGQGAVQAASRSEQAMGALDAVFGRNASKVRQWADDAADSLGLARSEYGELATVIGSQLRNAGLPLDQVTNKTRDLIATGADLAAMYGGTTRQAVEALSSALKGETDPIERYGATITAAAVSAEMAAQGLDGLTGKAAAQAKAQATLALITKQTALAQGAAAREYDSAAASSQRLSAQFENMQADLGKALLPLMVRLGNALADAAKWASNNTRTVQILAGVFGGLAVAVLAVNAALKAYAAATVVANAATALGAKFALGTRIQLVALAVAEKAAAVASKAYAAAQWLVNAALTANPIGLIIVAIVALVAAIVIAYKRSETFRNIVNAAVRGVAAAFKGLWRGVKFLFDWIKSHWRLLAAILFGPVGIAVGVITKHWSKIRSGVSTLLSWIKAVWRAAFGFVADVVRTYINTVRTIISTVRDAVRGVIDFLRSTWNTAWNGAKNAALKAVNAMLAPVNALVNAVQSLIGWIGRIKFPSPPGWLSKIPGVRLLSDVTPAPAAYRVATVPGVRAGVGAPAVPMGVAGGGGMVQINVTGALDPEAVARQINRILSGHNRRVGLVAT